MWPFILCLHGLFWFLTFYLLLAHFCWSSLAHGFLSVIQGFPEMSLVILDALYPGNKHSDAFWRLSSHWRGWPGSPSHSAEEPVCLFLFLILVTKHLTKAINFRFYFDSPFENPDSWWEGMAAGAWGSQSHGISGQEAERDEHRHSACFLLFM